MLWFIQLLWRCCYITAELIHTYNYIIRNMLLDILEDYHSKQHFSCHVGNIKSTFKQILLFSSWNFNASEYFATPQWGIIESTCQFWCQCMTIIQNQNQKPCCSFQFETGMFKITTWHLNHEEIYTKHQHVTWALCSLLNHNFSISLALGGGGRLFLLSLIFSAYVLV